MGKEWRENGEWMADKTEERRFHVYPVNDLIEHVLEGYECPCNPRVDFEENGIVVIHAAMDRREMFEPKRPEGAQEGEAA